MNRRVVRRVCAGRGRWRHVGRWVAALLAWWCRSPVGVGAQTVPVPAANVAADPAPDVRLDSGRFTVVAAATDARLARALLAAATTQDSFPGLPAPRARVLIAIAPNAAWFRAASGGAVPEWGAAFAVPAQQRVVLQGQTAGSDAGDPRRVLRHELAHLALHEALGALPPRWFDEGYASLAAGEWDREAVLETVIGMVWHPLPSRESLDSGVVAGSSRAAFSYAIAHRVVAELAALDPVNGLANLLAEWKASGSFDVAVRRAYGMTTGQFDAYWQRRTRATYGALAVATDLSAIGGVFTLILGPLFWLRRRRDRRRLEALRAADARQDAESAALAAMMAMDSGAGPCSETAGEGIVTG